MAWDRYRFVVAVVECGDERRRAAVVWGFGRMDTSLSHPDLSLDNISVIDRLLGVVNNSKASTDPRSFLPLSQAQFHVLVALTAGDRHGYAIMGAVEESSGGVVRIGPATLYGTLHKLVEHDLVEESDRRPSTDDDARRRYYRLTGLGRNVCRAEADRLAALVTITRSNLEPGLA